MGLMFRRRRPIARLAAGAAVGGAAYHMGKQRQQQNEINDEAQAAYAASQAPPQYAPAPPPPAPAAPAASAGDMGELEKLAEMHGAGVLTDDEFAAAKARLLGM